MYFLRLLRRKSKSREKKTASKSRCISSKCSDNSNVVVGEIQWEVRPGGMLVQKRQCHEEDLAFGSMIQIRVSHGLCHCDLTVPAQSTFGELKKVLAGETGLEPEAQRLLYQGKEREDNECLHMVGVTKLSKVVLLEDPASKQKKLEEMRANIGTSPANGAVDQIKVGVDTSIEEVAGLKEAVARGEYIADKEITGLTEQLMVLLPVLDGIKADGDERMQRRVDVRRIQTPVEILDHMRVFSRLAGHNLNAGRGSMDNEVFRPKFRSLNVSSRVTQDWEVFN